VKAAKALTVRLTQDQAEALETVAAVDSMAVSEVIRAAIEHHIESRSQEDDFQQGLQARLERAQRLLRRPV
jgi:predicted transcriptional regulator